MPKNQMLINYAPGEECRVAMLEDGKLEEYHAEPTRQISRVNNIYVGKVKNIESAIQAAFVDFGIEHAGFLHVSDLHPMYFPGQDDETTERVGKKTPRRERPPIQQCLRKGQEVVVQVLKEGVGTKGPTVTSYLSIPGRYLVMMPQMDRVGVSRKVEDEDQRKQMRDILNQLDLPEGFGFILRTAGFERNKAELKRDLAYLQRLWKDMEKRQSTGKGPRLLYAESDLLVRAIRDWLTSEIDQVIIDHPTALARAAKFMKIVAPRASAKIMRSTSPLPLFHAFGVEEQIQAMHSADVPLPSGGRLVIDETEALVAIDVNSGKSRSARDAETNAVNTNLEAVDEICRQIRLRDLGGLVINDLIDMRSASNRKKVEQRFRERLKRDRARSTILPISAFGILEMTRQRQRASHERTHFTQCPSCHGRGLVQKPGSVANDALRELESTLSHEKAHRAELVVSSRLAGELLSMRRQSITRIERTLGKSVDVRVSEAIQLDRFTIYIYDEQGTDLKIDARRRKNPEPKLEPWNDAEDDWAVDPASESAPQEIIEDDSPDDANDGVPSFDDIADEQVSNDEGAAAPTKKKRRRRRRGRRSSGTGADTSTAESADSEAPESTDAPRTESTQDDAPDGPEASPGDAIDGSDGGPIKKKRRRRRGRRSKAKDTTSAEIGDSEDAATQADEHQSTPGGSQENPDAAKVTKKKTRRRRSTKKASPTTEIKPKSDNPATPIAETPSATKQPTRSLYGASRRTRSPSERTQRPSDR